VSARLFHGGVVWVARQWTVHSRLKREAKAIPINHEEVIENLEAHIRRFGGALGERCVGMANDAHAPFFRQHMSADLGEGLIYREAFTTAAADQVIDHLVNNSSMHGDLGAVPERGKFIFV